MKKRIWIITDKNDPWYGKEVYILHEYRRSFGLCEVERMDTGERGEGEGVIVEFA